MKIALSKYTKDNFRVINHLHGNVQEVLREFLYRLAIAGIYVRITSGFRTKSEQEALYAQGRTKPGPIVTNANDSNSYHCHGVAIDIVPLKRLGPIYYTPLYIKKYYVQITYIATELGLTHPIPGDEPHYEASGGLTIAQLKAGQQPPKIHFTPVHRPVVLQRAIARLQEAGIIPF